MRCVGERTAALSHRTEDDPLLLRDPQIASEVNFSSGLRRRSC